MFHKAIVFKLNKNKKITVAKVGIIVLICKPKNPRFMNLETKCYEFHEIGTFYETFSSFMAIFWYIEGVIPVILRKTLLNVEYDLKPTLSATALIV